MTHNIPDNRDISCYHVTKHSWRGKYKRIFSIGTHGISTYEPSTLGLTNAWSYDQVVSLTLSKSSNTSDKSQQSISNSSPIAEFILTFRTKSKKNDTMRFSSEYRSDIITDALRFQTLFYHHQQATSQPKVIHATKIHWSSQRLPVLLRIQSHCIDQIDATTNRYLCSYEYKDIEQLIPLTSEGDTTVRGFLIQDKHYSRLHAFVTTETSTLFQNIIDSAHTNIGVQIRLSKKSYTLNDYNQLRFGPTYISDEHLTSFAEFIVYKHSSRHVDHVRRLLCLTETCLIERDPATYHICTLKPLNEIFGLVRHKDSLQEFTIEYIRNNPTRSKCRYTSTERDILLATLLDGVRSAGNNDCCVKTNPTDRGKRFAPFGHLVDDEVEIQHLKFLVQPPSGRLSTPQDSNNPSASQGGVSFNEILKRFNANVPYSGLINAVSSEGLFAENKEKLIHSALNTLVDTDTTTNVVDLEFIEDQYLAFRRLLASKAGFQAFTQLPKFRERIGTKIVRSLKLNDDQITYAALEVLNTLLQPMHLDYDLRQEQLNKSSILSTKKFLESLLDIFLKHVKQNTGSLIISSFLDFLTYTLCPPFSETTDGQHFDVLLELVSSNGRIFFKLFQHSSFTIVKGAGSIMKAIIEEGSSDISAHMQDLALSEGALPVHLLRALFTASNDSRLLPLKYLSQQLLGLWATGHPTTFGLLKRIFPLGLIAYLDSNEEPEKDFDEAALLGRDTLRLATEQHAQTNKSNALSTSIINTANKIRNATQMKILEQHVQHAFQHWSLKFKQNSKLLSSSDNPNATGTNISSHSNDKQQPVVLRKPRQRIRAEKNWRLFYQKFVMDHARPTLIWNNKTRDELRETIENEIRNFNIDKDLGHGHLISWNHNEFEVLYQCLNDEIKIGSVYLRLLLEQGELTANNDAATDAYNPSEFFNDLYHRFLLSQPINTKQASMKSMCLQAMTIVYARHYETIGPFNDTRHIILMLDRSTDKCERDRLLMFISKLILNHRNVRDIIDCGGIKIFIQLMCLAHLHINRAQVPLASNVLESSTTMTRENEKEWYYGKQDKEKVGPYSFSEIKDLYKEGTFDAKTRFWAQGLDGWKTMDRIPQLKWIVFAGGQSIFNDSELAATILDILNSMCELYPSRDQVTGAIIRPFPKIKRLLNDPTCLPHIVQLLLTFDPNLVEKIVILLNKLTQDNPLLPQFYMTGVFYFILMYTGSNILPIGHFLKYTHLAQAFRSDEQQQQSGEKKDIYFRSILGHILPEAMICYLENHGPEKFAQMFLGEFDQPETIWSNEMRRLMIEKIAVHLADYSPRLMSNISAIYSYCTIPIINYPQLENELFCNTYYLRHLCDEQKFPEWPIRDPIALLKDCLNMWKAELEKKGSDMSVDEAYQVLGLNTKDESNSSDSSANNGPHNESTIRKAYFRLANKYHPDKNPNGRDMFERVNKAYEFLCAASRIQQGPNEFNIYLLLKTQSILYRRYKTLLSEYKYAGYPLLIRILETEAKNDQLFSMGNTTKATALLPIAIELLYYTLDCSELNCEELRRENGLEILTQVFQRCSSVITKSSKSDDFIVAVCQYSALCYSVAGHFEKSRDLFIDPDKLQCVLRELCHCLNYTHLKQLCTCVCKAAISLCDGDVRLRDLLHRHGLFVYACRGLFNYDYTLDESGIADPSNKQYVDNQLACDYLQTLASLIPNNPPAFIAAQTFLTPYIVSQLPDRMVLKLLNSNQEQPYLVWDNSCRQELIDKLDETRDYLVKNEYKLNIEKFGNPSDFLYSAHKTELIIGEIFVRVYNLQPTTVLKDPKKFCSDLIDFLGTSSQYVNTLMAMQLQHEQEQKSNDDKKSTEGLHRNKQEHISQALEALKNVIRNNMGIETLCIGHFKLLFSLLRMENVARLQQNALELILHLSGSNECVNDISQSNVIVYLLLVLRSSLSNQETTLEILNALSSNGKIVRDIVDSGGLLYLLDIFSNGQNSNLREYAANVLSKLMNDRLHGPRIRLQLIKYLPGLVVDAMRESCETSIQLFETTHENPELIWNDHTREMTCERIGKQINEFYLKQRIAPTETKWSIDDAYQLLGDDEETQRIRQNELLVGGVYVRLLIANPGWVVRRPKEFLTELLSRWTTHTKQPEQLLMSHTDEFEMLTQCLIQLLHAQPTLCEHLPSIGFLPSIVQALECKSNGAIVASAIKVLFALCKSEVCLQTFSTKCPQIINGFRQAMETRRDQLGLIAESLHDLFRTPPPGTPDEFIKDALRCQLIEHILTLLNQPLADVEKPGSCKAHLVDSCKLMAESLVYGEQVLSILQSSTVWNDYKDQRHDLFIQTSSHMQAITGGSVGPQIAGYLTSSVSSTTAGKQNMTVPPPLVDQ
ncbi:unnamed protein product [Rotaria sp. Silwood1]|nr:unnamed protein product [Rotaria sp. Silwood1]